MRRSTFFSFCLMAGALLCAASAAQAATLQIVVHGVRDATGTLRAGVYTGPEGFPRDDKATYTASLPAAPGEQTLIVRDLPAGRYAVVVYHDADNNGKLNKRFGMIPTEGYGLSNNPQIFGKPGFDACAFELNDDTGAQPTRLDINLSY